MNLSMNIYIQTYLKLTSLKLKRQNYNQSVQESINGAWMWIQHNPTTI